MEACLEYQVFAKSTLFSFIVHFDVFTADKFLKFSCECPFYYPYDPNKRVHTPIYFKMKIQPTWPH